MTAFFTWLDHSERDRRKVLEAIERYGETDTRDELGLASIRDAFADLFFPGTSVLMTRPRYFLFVPWLYCSLEGRGAKDVAARIRRSELKLIDAIGDVDGNIGRRAKSNLKRTASSIYWLGLHTWGIRRFRGSQADYERLLERGAFSNEARLDDDGELVSGPVRNWDAAVPSSPAKFPETATLDLRSKEARYLEARIRTSCRGSLLEWILRRGTSADVPFPWLHPAVQTLPKDLAEALGHAERFSEAMHGAALLYNLMVAKAAKQGRAAELAREGLDAWQEELKTNRRVVQSWNRGAFWSQLAALGGVRASTMRFVNAWLDAKLWERASSPVDNGLARSLIEQRELELKKGRARLGNARALELWGGQSMAARISYRWPTAQNLLSEIRDALPNGEDDA